MKKILWVWSVGLVVGLYRTFIIESFWNWFVVGTFDARAVSFWGMYALVLLVGIFADRHSQWADEQRWRGALTVLDSCIPEDKREFVHDEIKSQTEGAWLELGINIFSEFVGMTLTLGIGFAIHSFLV